MKLSPQTKVHDLLSNHPFLEDFLASYNSKFEMLKNRMARATIGRVATLRTAAGIASLDLEAFLRAIAAEIEAKTGRRPEVEISGGEARLTREHRIHELKAIIGDLHAGGDLEQARARFARAVEDVEASEIAAMEEELIRGGLPVSEVQRLCDVHIAAFRQALDQHAEIEASPGHPIHTYLEDNRILTRLANQLASLGRAVGSGEKAEESFIEAERVLDALKGLENHYQRKENQLFPILERHGVTGPSQVMWGVHDQIRAALKKTREAVEKRDVQTFSSNATTLARDIVEMVYKEEKILFPLALQTLSNEEWIEVRCGEDELGYALAKPAAAWPESGSAPTKPAAASPETGTAPTKPAAFLPRANGTTEPAAAWPKSSAVATKPVYALPEMGATPMEPVAPHAGLLELLTGRLSLEQVNLIFTHLPVDLSFVDENDEVRFYSEGPHRIFPRSPAVIGRKVQLCHPPKSVHIVQEILDSFRAGTKDVAEFWIQLRGRFIHIRYFAVRDRASAYRGCLEVTQDVTEIRKLKGEQRLLNWKGGTP